MDEQSKTFIDYSGKFFSEYLDDTDEIIWMSERDGWNHLYLYDAKTGQVKNQITKGEWVVRGVERVDKEKRQIWFRAGGIRPGQDPYYIHYCRVNFDGTGLTILTEGDGTHIGAVLARPPFLHRHLVARGPAAGHRTAPQRRRQARLQTGRGRRRANWSPPAGKPPERFVAKGRDGETDIYGVIFRPKNFDPTEEVSGHRKHLRRAAGFVRAEELSRGPTGMQELAERGFIVVQIDGMGTSNRSKKFHDVCWKNLGDAGFPDRILWIKAAAAKYPYMDLTRVGIYGGSAGGQNALARHAGPRRFLQGRACRTAAATTIAWTRSGGTNSGWAGRWPAYAEQSNVTDAHKLQGKLLLMVGELDQNVDPASTMQVVNALIKADKDFDLLVIPGAGHGVARTPYGARRLEDFFVRNLLGTEAKSGMTSTASSAP